MFRTPSVVSSLVPVLLFAALPTAAASVGATLAAWRPPSARVQSYVQHFAAGVVFALVGGELLGDLKRIHTPVEITLGFAAGVAAMLGIRTWTRRLAPAAAAGGPPGAAPTESARGTGVAPAREPRAIPWALVATIAIDVVVDGLLIGIGFAAGSGTGRLLALALTIELLSLGIAVAVELVEATGSRVRGALGASALALLIVPAAALGTAGLRGAPESALAAVLAFGAAALLFLVTEELLTEAHAVPETPLSTTMFFAGFLALFLLELYQ